MAATSLSFRSKQYQLKQRRKQQGIQYGMRDAQVAYSFLSIPEGTNFGFIFLAHIFISLLTKLFMTPLRFFVFPSAAIYGLSKAAVKWRIYRLQRKDKSISPEDRKEKLNLAFLGALWETINAFGTTGAVITGVVGYVIGADVGMGISLNFSFFLTASTLVCLGFGLYLRHRANQTAAEAKKLADVDVNSPEAKALNSKAAGYRFGANINFNFAIIVALLTTGVNFAMVGGAMATGGVIGITGCAAAVGYTTYLLYQLLRPAQRPVLPTIKLDLHDSSTIIHKQLLASVSPQEAARKTATVAPLVSPQETSNHISISPGGYVSLVPAKNADDQEEHSPSFTI